MGLGGLDTALSGLRVAQQQLSVIANNVSNVNTEGYTRKILPQETVSVDGQSVGVRANSIIRNVDLNLERDLWTQVSTVEFLGVKETFLNRIQQFHGPPDLEVSIAAELGQLRDKFSSLSDSPEDNFLQRAVVDQAVLMANKVNDFSDLLTQMRNDAQGEILVSVTNVNEKLEQIADLNQQIKFNQISGKTSAALEDVRDQTINQLSQEMEISFFTRGDGVLVVQTANGVQLADERAETVFFSSLPLGPNSFFPDPTNPNVGALFVGGDPASNALSINITQSGLNGKIGALLELRDEMLPKQQAMLDELAHKMASHFQDQGLTLFTNAGGQVPSDSTANLIGNLDITGGLLSPASAPNDTFTITLNANGASPQQQTLTINLTAAEAAFIPPAADGAEALRDAINAGVATLPDAFSSTTASLDANGFLNITSDFDIAIDANGPGEMGDVGLATLGLTRGTEFAAPKVTPLTPVPYVGFAAEIRVNELVINDNGLVQQGTAATDLPVQSGSNEVIRRVIEFVFGDTTFQEATGNVDLRAAASGGTTLQDWLGIFSENSLTTSLDLSQYSDVNALLAAGGTTFIPAIGPVLDQFSITFDDPRTGAAAQTYILDLEEIQANFPIGGAITNAADQMAAAINALPLAGATGVILPGPPPVATEGVAPPDPAFDVQASVNPFGQLIISSRANVTLDAGFPSGDDFGTGTFDGGMRDAGLEFLGLQSGVFQTTDPYIDIQIGNDPPTRITIEPGDDETTLLDKLNLVLPGDPLGGVPGLAVDDDLISIAGNGFLILRPGDDPSNPSFGGDIKITGGPFQTTVAGGSGVPLGATIIAALFGTDSPVQEVPYELSTGTGTYEAFRRDGLGPGANISTGIISSSNLIDYAQKMVNKHTEESIRTASQIQDETSFRDLLQRRLLDESGVNLDEELSNLIIVQTAFAAAARVISAIDEEFQELLNAVL